MTNGRVTNSSAITTATRVYAAWMPIGEFGPYMASKTRLATMVGNAKGRSITELTTRFPRKSSRTSTQAINVPITALIATTINDEIRVSLIAATASLSLIASQK